MENNSFLLAASEEQMNDLVEAKRLWSRQLLLSASDTPRTFRAMEAIESPEPERNVVGIGIGEKIVEGMPVGILAVKFLVRRKYPKYELEREDLLPVNIDGLPVDIEEVGTFRRLGGIPIPNPRQGLRPAQPGCSIGFHEPGQSFKMAGTLGAIVRKEDRYFILSNNHVLADEDNLQAGAAIYQPGILDNGDVGRDRIASLSDTVRLDLRNFNVVDAAIAELDDNGMASSEILYIGNSAGPGNARRGMIVHKFGRTTAYTVGTITSTATDVIVRYETGEITFEDQILMTSAGSRPFSAGGDSGSLIIDRDSGQAVGLLFAGSETHTLANHIGEVLAALQVDLVT